MKLCGFNFCSVRGRKGGVAAAGALSSGSRHKGTGISNRFVSPLVFTFLTRIGQFTCSSFIRYCLKWYVQTTEMVNSAFVF